MCTHPTVRSSVSVVVVGFWVLAGLLGGCGGKGLSRRGTGGTVASGGLSESGGTVALGGSSGTSPPSAGSLPGSGGLASAGGTLADGGSTGGTSMVDAALIDAPFGFDGAPARVPNRHRPAGIPCPQERGSAVPEIATWCPPSVARCKRDTECTAAPNGRCLVSQHSSCTSDCSYDTCTSDSDCSGVPCECRPDGASAAANTCVTGSNCAIDADCGPGGFCSPSVVGMLCGCLSSALCSDAGACYAGTERVPCACGDACGHGYFCHTPRDTCIDDSDCERGDTCNYNRLESRWSCSFCMPPP